MHRTPPVPRLAVTLLHAASESAAVVKAAAFWAAVLLPFGFLWLLFDGSHGLSVPRTLLRLAALHVLCLVVGRDYAAPADDGD